MATIQGETMLDSDHNGPFFKETLASQIEQLGYFRIEEPPFDIYLLEYHLQTIFNTLFYAMDKYPSLGPHLDPVDQSKLAQICIQLIDSEEFVNYCSKWHHVDHMWLNEVWALKILVLITKQPFVETHSREILNLIHKSLANKLNRPCAPIDKGQFGEIMGLIANCLAQDNFKHIISSIEAQNMIKDLVLPLAVCCLGEETQHDKRAFKVFQRDFHGKYSRDTRALVDGGQFKFAYPLVVRLLLALAKQSESSSSSSGYIRVFESMLGTAMETGSITDEHIVALSVIRTSGFSPLIASLIDLLTKSEGLQRAHIAYMIWWELMFTNDNESMTETDRVTFTMIMIDDLIAKNDELLDQIAISSFSLIKDDDKFDWRRRVSGKEMRIIKKLVGTGCKPNQLNKFLKHLDHIKGSETLEFYTLTRLPISQAIYKLYHLVKLTSKRSPDVMEQFVDYFECLENLLRLHRHRLEQDAEMKLMEVFDLLSDDQFIKDRKRDHGFILVFANAYLVYPYAWNSIIKMIRLVQQTEPISPNRKLTQDTLNKTFSHLLMIDADYFYGKFATPEVLKLLFEYCERIADSSSVKCLLKEILLTWPKEFQKTRLDSVAHRLMLKKFIELLIDALDSARDRVRASRRADEINGFLDRLSGLVIAFSRHRDQLNEVLDELGEEQENRDSWLKSNMSNWTRLVIDSANRIGCSVRMDSYLFKNDLKGCFMLTEFADIVVAHEGLLMIRDGSIECHKLAKSFGALLETVQLALDTNLERTPVNSREYKRYQVIKASLQDERMVDWLFPMVRQVRTQWFNNAAIGRRLCNRVRDIRDSLQATTSRPSS